MEAIGDEWGFLILRDAFLGIRSFSDFQRRLGVSRNVLAERLRHMVDHQILEKRPAKPGGTRLEYRLTERGKALFPVIVSLLQWGDKWCDPDRKGNPMRLTHSSCGHSLQGQVKCSACDGVLKAREVKFSLGQATLQ